MSLFVHTCMHAMACVTCVRAYAHPFARLWVWPFVALLVLDLDSTTRTAAELKSNKFRLETSFGAGRNQN